LAHVIEVGLVGQDVGVPAEGFDHLLQVKGVVAAALGPATDHALWPSAVHVCRWERPNWSTWPRALRRERAAHLLDAAYARNPNGALTEEILSLRVEAALARYDPQAHSFARQYLKRYPTGRYRETVQRALK
jgi:hypothetical protein